MKGMVLLTVVILCVVFTFPASTMAIENDVEIIRSERSVNIGTHSLRVVISDVEGSEYTIVLEAGGGMNSDVYRGIQERIAESTGHRVISYDRSGFGKSELGPEKFNASDEMAALKKCLELLGYEGRFVLAGHSYGGFLIQVFAHQYPKLVSGLVLIDPMNVCFVDRFGLDNLNAVTPYFKNPSDDSQRAGNRMVDHFPESLSLIRGKALPAGIPAVLLTAGNFPMEPKIWRDCHKGLVSESDNHRMVIADGSSHDIVHDDPDLVVSTINELVGKIEK